MVDGRNVLSLEQVENIRRTSAAALGYIWERGTVLSGDVGM